MNIIHRGHRLTQAQLDAIVPVLNDVMHGKIGQGRMEAAVDAALFKAGCPIPLRPSETGVGRLCAPGPAAAQGEAFLLRFADQDREDGIFFDRAEARAAFAKAEALGWNCYLFELSRRDEEGDA